MDARLMSKLLSLDEGLNFQFIDNGLMSPIIKHSAFKDENGCAVCKTILGA